MSTPESGKAITHAYTITHKYGESLTNVAVVGAGGTGARLIPLLIKMLPARSVISVYDFDHVEQKNLWRQHFHEGDLGRNKAEIMAERYHGCNGVEVRAFDQAWTEVNRPPQVVFSCVDNRAARAAILRSVINRGVILIDAGNATTTGQILLGWNCYEMRVHDMITGKDAILQLLDPAKCMPEVYDPAGDATDLTLGCANADLQTVVINNLSAAVAANAFYLLLNKIPFWAAGWWFTSENAIRKIELVTQGDPLYGAIQAQGVWRG